MCVCVCVCVCVCARVEFICGIHLQLSEYWLGGTHEVDVGGAREGQKNWGIRRLRYNLSIL